MALYKTFAVQAAKVWRKHGALTYSEVIEDDVPMGKVTSFPQSVKLKKGETIVIGMVTYRSRKHRDQVIKKVMTDPYSTSADPSDYPVDGKRMFWGGFAQLIKA
jgi:uncharacterized protein YbaA (DUF1428 family)